MLSRLFDLVGFPWAVRTLAFMCFTLQAISIPFIKERFPPQVGAPRFDPSASQDMPFMLHVVGAFFISFGMFHIMQKARILYICKLTLSFFLIGLYTPLWYIELYALQQGVNASLSFYLISIMNASAIFGRIILGQLGDAVSLCTSCPLCRLSSIYYILIRTTIARPFQRHDIRVDIGHHCPVSDLDDLTCCGRVDCLCDRVCLSSISNGSCITG